MLSKYGIAKNVALPFLFSVSVCLSGYPLFLIAPSGAYKSTVIEAVKRYCEKIGEYVMPISVMNLGNLTDFSEEINENLNGLSVVNDDFSHIATGGTYNIERSGELIGALSYKGTYINKRMKIDIRDLKRLGFVTGCQPSWLETIIRTETWENFYKQRFLRYYILPEFPSSFRTDENEIIDRLVSVTPRPKSHPKIIFKARELMDAFNFQMGDRGTRAYERIIPNLYSLTGETYFHQMTRLIAFRLNFERYFISRIYEPNLRRWEVSCNDIEFCILNIVCRHNPCTVKVLKQELNWIDTMEEKKQKSNLTLIRCIKECEELGWIKRIDVGGGSWKVEINPELKRQLR